MANRRISYTVRDFEGIRAELQQYVRIYYPELIQNFNDASVFSVFLDLNAAVADNLNFQIDRSIQETVLQYAQQRSSIYNIARTYGLKLPGQRPSVALVDFSITVPAFGDKEDERYLGTLRRGSQVLGAGQVFENVEDIDFASPYNSQGFPNRLKIPNFDASNRIINYTITKREIVVNGITKVFKRVITANDVRPFYEIFLPGKNVLGITSIIQKDGTNYANVPGPQEFLGTDGRWYEVDALAQDRVFLDDFNFLDDLLDHFNGDFLDYLLDHFDRNLNRHFPDDLLDHLNRNFLDYLLDHLDGNFNWNLLDDFLDDFLDHFDRDLTNDFNRNFLDHLTNHFNSLGFSFLDNDMNHSVGAYGSHPRSGTPILRHRVIDCSTSSEVGGRCQCDPV